MIGKSMQDAMNEQINKEFFSSYLYLSMAAYFEDKNLMGFGHWMRLQADEEREHAMKFYDYILDSGGRVQLKALDAPATEWKSNLEVAEQVAEHEAKVTASIHALYELALKEKDYRLAGDVAVVYQRTGGGGKERSRAGCQTPVDRRAWYSRADARSSSRETGQRRRRVVDSRALHACR